MRISDEARQAIETYCVNQGMTVTAWFEAIGRRLDELHAEAPDPSLQHVAAETVRIARQIDAERRSRRIP